LLPLKGQNFREVFTFHTALGNYSALRAQFLDLADPGKVFLITHTTKEQLLHIVAQHGPGEPFKLDDIMEQQLPESIRFPFM
jgi:hypothetical protein